MAEPVSEVARTIGSRLRDTRTALPGPPSQQDIAELAGIHFTNYAKIERGETHVRVDTLVRLAAALELDPAVLVAGLSPESLPERDHRLTVRDLLRARGQLR